jgi:hypothetical protein
MSNRNSGAGVLIAAILAVSLTATTAIQYYNTASGFVIPGIGKMKSLAPIAVSG